MESREQRLKRWLENDPSEIFGWMLVWAQNGLVPQIKLLAQPGFEEGLFLLTHSFVQTFMENYFDTRGRDATHLYLKWFVDGRKKLDRFSLVSDELHEMRNVMAHQIYSSQTNYIRYEYALTTGWARQNQHLQVNPRLYADRFIDGLEGRVHRRLNSVTRLEQARRKYRFIAKWLHLGKADPLRAEIMKLCEQPTLTALRRSERRLKKSLRARYGL